jgi:methylated-DNA-[protein]-cysteine S-methyltransferase
MLRYASMSTPLGPLWAALGPRGLCRVSTDVDEATFIWALDASGQEAVAHDPSALRHVLVQFAEYFDGARRTFDVDVDLSALGSFQRCVLDAVRRVPYGAVRSYGAIAVDVGRPRAARAVGTALATNPLSIVVPCHRIIRSDGSMGEFGPRSDGSRGRHEKRLLLALEGVEFGRPD